MNVQKPNTFLSDIDFPSPDPTSQQPSPTVASVPTLRWQNSLLSSCLKFMLFGSLFKPLMTVLVLAVCYFYGPQILNLALSMTFESLIQSDGNTAIPLWDDPQESFENIRTYFTKE